MKKIFLALMCMAGLTMMMACGGGNASKNNAEAPADGEIAQEQTEQAAAVISPKDVTTENFAEVMKGLVGIELNLPEGWTAKSVEGTDMSMGKTLRVNFGPHEDALAVGKQLFDKCNELTKVNLAKCEGFVESFYKDWNKQLDSKLEDHTYMVNDTYMWKMLYDKNKDATIYFYTDPAELKLEVPNKD